MRTIYEHSLPAWLLSPLVGSAVMALMVFCLSACATDQVPPPQIIYKQVDVPVATACVVNQPAKVVPLNQQTAAQAWQTLPTGAKASAVAAQGGRRLDYEDQLLASQAGCPAVGAK